MKADERRVSRGLNPLSEAQPLLERVTLKYSVEGSRRRMGLCACE